METRRKPNPALTRSGGGNRMGTLSGARSPALFRRRMRDHWRANLALIGWLLVPWFVCSFVMSYFARELAVIHFFGWPLSFYMGAQGTLVVFLVLIGVYARQMRKIDRQYGWSEDPES